MARVLFVDDQSKTANFILALLEKDTLFQVAVVEGSSQAVQRLEDGFDLVLTTYTGNDPRELNVLEHVRQYHPDAKCLVYSAQPSIKEAVSVVRRGAADYLAASAGADEIISIVKEAVRPEKCPIPRRRKEDFAEGFKYGDLVGKSRGMQAIFSAIEKVAASDSTVLITGESGTGKELVARAIHYQSRRCDKPLVTINCGAIPGELLESELFGHEKGAFTGAHRTRVGRFELADGGTIFLDEIGDMSPDLQVKLLRVLQEQNFERVGSTKTMTVDIRVLAATNKDLLNSIEEGRFREDLYYRLNVIPVRVPPLRERKSDIPLLINFFLKRLGGRRRQDRKRMKTFSDEALERMSVYEWPGNIRELENTIERLSVLVEEPVIQVADLPQRIRGHQFSDSRPSDPQPSTLPLDNGLGFTGAVEHYQKSLILQALKETNWVKAKAAELLKMNRTTLVEKIKKMNIESMRKN